MRRAVNLLPPELKPQRGFQTRHVLMAGLMGMLVLFSVLYGCQTYKISRAEQQLASLNREIEVLAPTMVLVERNKKLQQQFTVKNNTIAQIAKERPLKWSDTIVQLGEATPVPLWLTQVSSEANGLVKISGGAVDIETITTYIETLKEHPQFQEVTFGGLVQSQTTPNGPPNNVSLINAATNNMVSYELSLVVKGGGPR